MLHQQEILDQLLLCQDDLGLSYELTRVDGVWRSKVSGIKF